MADGLLQQLDALEGRQGLQLRSVRDLVQERFVKALAVDRLCVLVGPAVDEASHGSSGPALARFLEELAPHAATPTGSGLDVPSWLQRLHHEVRRLQSERTTGPGLRDAFLVPRRSLTLEDVRQQLADWEKAGVPAP
jgi:hypothetical protein